MKRIISGITSSNKPTIGNYIGAISRWAQHESSETQENFFFIANSHAITTRQDPIKLRETTLDNYAWLLACGVDPDKNTIFIQSMISAHAELTWILNNYTMVGELSRMTQYKDKSARFGAEGQTVGLFDYPVLMAADILLYDADEVPVGHDQTQHIELTRDIALRFNNLYGEVFHLPKAVIDESGARIKKLDNPAAKMSKSDPGPGTIYLDDDETTVKTKIKRAVTDSGDSITLSDDRAAVTNLIRIYAAMSGLTTKQVVEKYHNITGYSQFKTDLAAVVVAKLTTLQTNYHSIRKDNAKLMSIITAGNAKARRVADQKLALVKEKVGLL